MMYKTSLYGTSMGPKDSLMTKLQNYGDNLVLFKTEFNLFKT